MFGALLAFASAAFFGMNNAAARRAVLKGTVLQGLAITVPVGLPLLAPLVLVMGGFAAMARWDLETWAWMTLAGVVHFVVGRYGNYRTTQALGATLSTPIQQVSILVSLLLAFVFLDETVNAVNLLGILLVVFGPMVLLRRRKAASAAARAKGFEPQYGPGVLWGLVCAFGYGSSPLLISFGLAHGGGFADSVAGVFVSYAAATVVVLALVAAAGGRGYLATIDRGSGYWFLLSAVLVGISQLFRYLALAVAPVAVVVPIQRLSVVFRILFNAAINRDHEALDGWVIFSILLAVVGAIALSMDTGLLLDVLAVPDWLAAWLSRPLV